MAKKKPVVVQAKTAISIRTEVEEYVLSEIAKHGPDGIDQPAIAKRFVERGCSRSLVYRIIKDMRDLGDARMAIIRPPASSPLFEAVGELAPDESIDVLVASLPTVQDMIAVEMGIRGGHSHLAVMDQLKELVTACSKVLKSAHNDAGGVRNPRLLLQAIDHLRRLMETAAKISESINNSAKVERFMQEVVDCLREESPQLGQRVVARLNACFDRWDG